MNVTASAAAGTSVRCDLRHRNRRIFEVDMNSVTGVYVFSTMEA